MARTQRHGELAAVPQGTAAVGSGNGSNTNSSSGTGIGTTNTGGGTLSNSGTVGNLGAGTNNSGGKMLLEARVFHSIGGRSSRDEVSNTFLFTSDSALGSVDYKNLATSLAAAMGTILVDKARILRVVFAESKASGDKRTPGQFRKIGVDVVGSRQLAIGVDPSMASLVALFTKDAEFGYSGRQTIRGAFSENEIETGPNLLAALRPTTDVTPFTAFAANLLVLFSVNNATLVLPAPRLANFELGVRDVVSVAFQGLGEKQRYNDRISLESAEKAIAKRRLNAVARDYREAVADFGPVLTGWPAAVKAALVATLEALIAQYTEKVIVQIAAKAGLAFLLALL